MEVLAEVSALLVTGGILIAASAITATRNAKKRKRGDVEEVENEIIEGIDDSNTFAVDSSNIESKCKIESISESYDGETLKSELKKQFQFQIVDDASTPQHVALLVDSIQKNLTNDQQNKLETCFLQAGVPMTNSENNSLFSQHSTFLLTCL